MRKKYLDLEIGDVIVKNREYYVYLGVQDNVGFDFVKLYNVVKDRHLYNVVLVACKNKKNISKITNFYKHRTVHKLTSRDIYDNVQVADIDIKDRVKLDLIKNSLVDKNYPNIITIRDMKCRSLIDFRNQCNCSPLNKISIGDILQIGKRTYVYLGISENNLRIHLINITDRMFGYELLNDLSYDRFVFKFPYMSIVGHDDGYKKFSKLTIREILEKIK